MVARCIPRRNSTPMDNSKHFLHSTFREKLIEHLLVGELLKQSWAKGDCSIEISRPEVDRAGYDLIAECKGHVRHIQLKGAYLGSKAAYQKVQLNPGGKALGLRCVGFFRSGLPSNSGRFCFSAGNPERNCQFSIPSRPRSTPRGMRKGSRLKGPTTASSTRANSRESIRSRVSGITSSAIPDPAGGDPNQPPSCCASRPSHIKAGE